MLQHDIYSSELQWLGPLLVNHFNAFCKRNFIVCANWQVALKQQNKNIAGSDTNSGYFLFLFFLCFTFLAAKKVEF